MKTLKSSILVLSCINFFNLIDCDGKDCNLESELDGEKSLRKLLKSQDEKRWRDFEENMMKEIKEKDIPDFFHKTMASTYQSICQRNTKIGGHWLGQCGAFDGQKFVCLDKILDEKFYETRPCMVYSFGISNDWDFENSMNDLGCIVRAFDPTIDPETPTRKNVNFYPIGLSHKTGEDEVFMDHSRNQKKTVKVSTLSDLVKDFGDEYIDYLKVDVESSEIKAIPQWLKSGILEKVGQIGIEFHLGPVHVKTVSYNETLEHLLDFFRIMGSKYGFKIIDYSPNICTGKNHDPQYRKYHNYFDIVFYRNENQNKKVGQEISP